MKQVKQLLFLLILVVLSLDILPQEQPNSNPKFTIGAFVSSAHRTEQALYDRFIEAGLNTIVQRADIYTQPFLENLSVLAYNQENEFDYINHFATGYYTKWEAEKNQQSSDSSGIIHKYGQVDSLQQKPCWSSGNLGSTPADSLVFGPHYRQDKIYKQFLYNTGPVGYTARYNLALDYEPELVNLDDNVCVLRVTERFAKIFKTLSGTDTFTVHTITLKTDTLKVSEFFQDSSFINFDLTYDYPPEFIEGFAKDYPIVQSPEDTIYSDLDGDNGVEFQVEWLGLTSGKLYIDNIETYDDQVWNNYVDSLTHNDVVSQIKTYAQNYSNWLNLKYWYAADEPRSMDAFTPIHIVDSLVRSVQGSPLITEFYPRWLPVNGDNFLTKFYKMANPQKLMIDFYPISADYDIVRWEDLESTRQQFQIAHSLQPGFWNAAQSKQLMEGR